MTTESTLGTEAPDVGSLLASYREVALPAAAEFVTEKISANELRDRWRPYYYGAFHQFDRSVERSWRQSTGTDGGLESGPPTADPRHALPLANFPVSNAHNNLDRLIEVLAIELGDRTVAAITATERKVDFAHMVDKLEDLMSSLAR